jgi:hypothetical protein
MPDHSTHTPLQSDVAATRRTLALAKLAALAAGGEPAAGEAPESSASTVAEIDARLSLLALQVGVALMLFSCQHRHGSAVNLPLMDAAAGCVPALQ